MKILAPTLVAMLMATAAVAQTQPTTLRDQQPAYTAPTTQADGVVGSPNVYDGPADETPRDPYDPELDVTADLNAQIANRDRQIESADAAALEAYRAQEADYVRRVEQQQADYAAAQAAHQEAISRQAAEHAAALDAWRRCSAGDRYACTPPAPRY